MKPRIKKHKQKDIFLSLTQKQ
uniref:Uncharacterized protein n=1 Tax=Rhizophora mucronata TaxID=61149 RepID=A0A2P2QK58_RHIMU